jgi:hypothetical protein
MPHTGYWGVGRRPARGIAARISRLDWGVFKTAPMANHDSRENSFDLIFKFYGDPNSTTVISESRASFKFKLTRKFSLKFRLSQPAPLPFPFSASEPGQA